MDSLYSQPITWDEAQEMRDAYLANPAHLKTPAPHPLPGGYLPLKGLKVSAAALMNVINGTGPDGEPLQPPSNELILLFGVRQTDLHKNADAQCFTLIVAGVDADGVVREQVLYDFMEPCPPGESD